MKAYCYSEYDMLKQVILCEPNYMKIDDVINETQKVFEDEGINVAAALEQHHQFEAVLRNHGIDVIKLPSYRKFPEQVFTRDIGFTLGDKVFLAEMATEIRTGEEDVFKNWLLKEQVPFHNLSDEQIEGGDVLIDGQTIYIGLSKRTNLGAIEKIQKLLPTFEVIPIHFNEEYLHLDCVFNIISPTEALIFPDGMNEEQLKLLKKKYELIKVTKEEQFTLATNVLSIGNKEIIVLPMNRQTNKILKDRGYKLIEVDLSEIIKSGGAFRCCTLPIVRA